MAIKDLQSLRQFFKENVKTPVFGVGVYAFDRLGPEEFVKNYRILALRYSKDTRLIEKDIKVLALEKGMGTKHIKEPRNSTTIITHPATKSYLDNFIAPALLVYKSSTKMERVCRQNGWTLIAPPIKFGKKLFENKIKFRKILESIGVPPAPGEIARAKDLNFYELRSKYGLPFVIQHPKRGGGKGTFFIHSQDEWHNALKKLRVKEIEGMEIREDISSLELIAAKYIQGPSPSITGCVTRHGILYTNPQYQLIDIPELYNPKRGSGLFCGHDWSASKFPPEVLKQIYDAVERVGKYFAKFGYRGIFGLDFVYDEENKRVYVTESNPRLLGSFPVITMAQIRNNEPPIIAFHILEYLDIDYEIDKNKINSLIQQPKRGAQMFPHNLTGHWAIGHGKISAGIYKIVKDKLKFVGPGYALRHLRYKNEFLLTDGILPKGAHYSPNRRLGRIITLRRVLAKDKKTLSPLSKKFALKLHSDFELKKVWFVKIRKFFNPDFLAKG